VVTPLLVRAAPPISAEYVSAVPKLTGAGLPLTAETGEGIDNKPRTKVNGMRAVPRALQIELFRARGLLKTYSTCFKHYLQKLLTIVKLLDGNTEVLRNIILV
jgi:hypothetical protein